MTLLRSVAPSDNVAASCRLVRLSPCSRIRSRRAFGFTPAMLGLRSRVLPRLIACRAIRRCQCEGSVVPLSTMGAKQHYSSRREGRPAGTAALAIGLAAVLAGGAAVAKQDASESPVVTDSPVVEGGEMHTEGIPVHVEADNDYKLARQNTSRKVKNAYEYVIIGAGTTAYAAIEAIFTNKPDADVLLLSNEASLPHTDVFRHHHLSPSLLHAYNEWRRHITSKLESEPDAYSSVPMTVLLNKGKDMKLDVDKQRVLFDDGSYISFDRCLIATAGRPRGMWAVDRRKMSYSLRDRINICSAIEDFHQLENLHNTMANRPIAIVGGGFLATELALALAVKGRETGMTVSQIYAEKAPLARYIPFYLALHIQKLMHDAGVRCVTEKLVTDIKEGDEEAGGLLRMSLMGWNKETLFTDYAVLAPTHVDPCIDIGVRSGLEIDPVDGGIVVNQQLEAVSNVFVAGVVASYYDSALGRRRVEMFDHSINSGILAGYNMSVDDKRRRRRYKHQPMFRSHLKDIDAMAVGVGEIDSKMRTVGIWVHNRKDSEREECDYARGVVYYLEDNRVKGILLWNAAENVERAREVLRQQPVINSVKTLKRQIALAPDTWLRVIETEP